MYCSNCGNEITGIEKYCPKCGAKVMDSQQGINAGDFWQKYEKHTPKKPRKTWLWVLGWIFIFPLPLTLILIRKKEMIPPLKYGIIAAAWLLFVLMGIVGRTNKNTRVRSEPSSQVSITQTERATKKQQQTPTESKERETTAIPEKTESSTVAESNETIRKEIKEAIDSYEAFVDEYCEFMENYDSTDFSLLSQYMQLLSKEIEMSEKFEALEKKDLTEAEEDYYLMVQLRCSQKMIKAAGKIS